MQYAFKFDFNSRCQWGVAGALGAPDRKCRKPYIVGCFSNWKFIGSSKLLIENEPNEAPPPCAASSLWTNLFNLSNCLLSDLSVIEIIQERSTLHKRQCQQYRAIVSVSFPPLSISPSPPSVLLPYRYLSRSPPFVELWPAWAGLVGLPCRWLCE